MSPRRILRAIALAAPLAAPLAAVARAGAQDAERAVGSSANAWVDVTSDYWVTPTYDVQLAGKVQRSEMGAAPQQAELRLAVQRQLGPRFRAAAGGLLAHYTPAGPFPAAAPYGERRLWQQVTQEQQVGRVALQHRYRLEERWVERPVAGAVAAAGVDPDVAYGLRARYRLQATLPMAAASAHAPYATAYDELLKSVGPHAARHVALDQNRAYLAAGLRWSPALRGELGYVNQRIVRANGRQLEHAHTAQLALSLTRRALKR